MAKKYTKHEITESALKQLGAAVNRENGSLLPGIGTGAPSSRSALINRGLAEDIKRECKAYPGCSDSYGTKWDTIITAAGREALDQARQEGW